MESYTTADFLKQTYTEKESYFYCFYLSRRAVFSHEALDTKFQNLLEVMYFSQQQKESVLWLKKYLSPHSEKQKQL